MKIHTLGSAYDLHGRDKTASKAGADDACVANFTTVFQQNLTGAQAEVLNTKPEASENPFGVADVESLTSAFRTWKDSRQSVGASNDYLERIHDQADAFETLMHKASVEGGYVDPIAFIQGLSIQEHQTLQHIHSLAEPLSPGRLSQEGALNLLLPPNQRKDIDKNGFVMVGEAKTWVFPPVDAPAAVKAAWDQVVAESGKTELTLQGSFLPSPFEENAYIGTQVSSYLDLIAQRLEGAKLAQQYDFPWQRDERTQQIEFLTRFLSVLETTEVD